MEWCGIMARIYATSPMVARRAPGLAPRGTVSLLTGAIVSCQRHLAWRAVPV